MSAIQKLKSEAAHFPALPLDQLGNQLKVEMSDVNSLILERLDSHINLIPEIAQYILSAGGKRIRPLLTLACAAMFDYQGKEHVKLATAVEFIHTATLLHDDVVDESSLRRGKASAHTVWGNAPSILVGDFLFSRAFQLMVETHSLQALDVLSEASTVISEGEIQQLLALNDLSTTQETYMRIIESKTAYLFKAASQVGAIISEASEKDIHSLSQYGLNLGILFQLADDVIDYRETPSEMGKNRGDDLKEGKVTLPVILAYKKAEKSEKEFWIRCIEKSRIQEEDFMKAFDLLEDRAVYEQISQVAEIYVARAIDALVDLPDHPIKYMLKNIVEQVKKSIYTPYLLKNKKS